MRMILSILLIATVLISGCGGDGALDANNEDTINTADVKEPINTDTTDDIGLIDESDDVDIGEMI